MKSNYNNFYEIFEGIIYSRITQCKKKINSAIAYENLSRDNFKYI